MGRSDLKEKMRKGPSLSFVATQLDMSRPTLYRQMDNYVNGDIGKVNPYLREYFDNVLRGAYDNNEDAIKDLEQIRFFIDGKKEAEQEEFRKDWNMYEDDRRTFRFESRGLSTEAKVERQEALDKRRDDLRARAEKLGIDFDDLFSMEPDPLEWNEGEIRSLCTTSFDRTMVLIDADYARCRDVTVELLVTVSGKDFVLERIRPKKDRRYALVKGVMDNIDYRYRLRWNEDGQDRFAGPYPLRPKQHGFSDII